MLGIKYANQRLKEGLDYIKRNLLIETFNANWLSKFSLMTRLWAQIIKARYLRKCGFLQYQIKNTDSPIWKNLLKCRNLLKQGIRWKLTGDNISFWFDNWVDNHNLLLGVHSATIPEPSAMVSDVINNNRSWNMTKLHQCVQNHSVLLKIKGIDILFNEIEDSCWGLSS